MTIQAVAQQVGVMFLKLCSRARFPKGALIEMLVGFIAISVVKSCRAASGEGEMPKLPSGAANLPHHDSADCSGVPRQDTHPRSAPRRPVRVPRLRMTGERSHRGIGRKYTPFSEKSVRSESSSPGLLTHPAMGSAADRQDGGARGCHAAELAAGC